MRGHDVGVRGDSNQTLTAFQVLSLTDLAIKARSYVRARWPVDAGAWWVPESRRHWCGRPKCSLTAMHPVDLSGDRDGDCLPTGPWEPIRDAHEVGRHWLHQPYSPLLLTGTRAHAVEGDTAALGPVVRRLSEAGLRVPVLALRRGRLCLLTRPLGALGGDLSSHGLVHHGQGSWVPLPPAQMGGVVLGWVRTPAETAWTLPSTAEVGAALQALTGQPGPGAAAQNNGHHPDRTAGDRLV